VSPPSSLLLPSLSLVRYAGPEKSVLASAGKAAARRIISSLSLIRVISWRRH